MSRNMQGWVRWSVAVLLLVLPVVLLLSSWRSLRELADSKTIYLRDRAATLAARLENVNAGQSDESLFDMLAEEEPALLDLRIFRSPDDEPGNPVLRSLWNGEALFHTEVLEAEGERVFRIYTPFHLDGDVRFARIDLALDAAEFLVEHTRHHLMLSLLASVALVAFTGYFLWSERRASRFERQQLELEHLAHLGTMSAVLAHEIRNPLGTIKGFVQLAAEQSGETVRGLLSTVVEESQRLEALVNDLLLYGRPSQPRMKEIQWPELSSALEAHARATTGDAPVEFVTEGHLESLRSDPDLLTQVFLNLLRNAIDAVRETAGGKVTLTARPGASGGAVITVADNGPGLPEEVERKLFEPFATTKANGTGLGLPIARKLVTALGGSITMQTVSPHGTEARVTLPG